MTPRVLRAERAAFATIALCLLFGTSAPAADAPLRFEYVLSIGSIGTEEGQFKYVEDFAFSQEGHLLATDASHAWVQAFDKLTGQYVSRFGGKGDEDGNLEKPEGIAVDPSGNIFVADYTTGFVKKYDTGHRWISTFSDYGSGKGQTKKSEFMDIYDGKLFVPEAGNHRVSVFDLDGKFLHDFGKLGAELGALSNPEAAKVAPNGRLYVTDLNNDRVQVFDTKGNLLHSWGKSGSAYGEFKSPAGLAFDRNGNVYVTEIGNSRVQVFDQQGRFLTHFGKSGSSIGEFSNVHGIIVDPITGYVYVADTGNHRVQVFRPSSVPKS
jgi:DNA-binding beta-propeller fold protein YncE